MRHPCVSSRRAHTIIVRVRLAVLADVGPFAGDVREFILDDIFDFADFETSGVAARRGATTNSCFCVSVRADFGQHLGGQVIVAGANRFQERPHNLFRLLNGR